MKPPNFLFLVRTWMKIPNFFVVGEFPCLVRLSAVFFLFYFYFYFPIVSDDGM